MQRNTLNKIVDFRRQYRRRRARRRRQRHRYATHACVKTPWRPVSGVREVWGRLPEQCHTATGSVVRTLLAWSSVAKSAGQWSLFQLFIIQTACWWIVGYWKFNISVQLSKSIIWKSDTLPNDLFAILFTTLRLSIDTWRKNSIPFFQRN